MLHYVSHFAIVLLPCKADLNNALLENKIYYLATLVSLELGDVAAAIVAVAVRVDASISLMSSKSQARSFSLSES